ncbi:MAG: hypothetical protein HYZ14_01885 [Bacteroidetes bacterium]|nr:hypothetical protein [Bacteroidota bacterium]
MKFKLLFIVFFAGLNLSAQYDLEHVQKDSSKRSTTINWFEIKKRTYVGGDLAMRFGNLTYIYGAPIIGYDFYKKASVGVTGIYQLYRLNMGGAVQTEHTAGGGVFVRWRPLDFVLVQTEFDLLNTVNYDFSIPDKRVNVPVFMLGAGYCGSMGDRAYYNVMLMYDLINDPAMPVPKFINPIPLYLRYGFAWYLG